MGPLPSSNSLALDSIIRTLETVVLVNSVVNKKYEYTVTDYAYATINRLLKKTVGTPSI